VTRFLLTWLLLRVTTTLIQALTDEFHSAKKGPNGHLMGAIFLKGCPTLLTAMMLLKIGFGLMGNERGLRFCQEVFGLIEGKPRLLNGKVASLTGEAHQLLNLWFASIIIVLDYHLKADFHGCKTS
jgi:hypothetical protein